MIQGISPAISALKAFGKRIANTANNISNVGTQGYKKSTSTSTDLSTYDVATASGTSQVGRGSTLGTISQDFQQGSVESVSSPTSMSIGGDGFFMVKDPDGRIYYTREGQFHFDMDGHLVNSQGYTVQGWQVDPNSGQPRGSLTDISMTSFTSAPSKTDTVNLITNLNSDAVSQSNMLSNKWDATHTPPIDSANYQYQTTVKTYDALGNSHDVTVYYDKISDSQWEYLVTTNPSEDLRSSVQGTASQGLLARGTITFGQSSGKIQDMTMQRFTGLAGNVQYTGGSNTDEGTHLTLNNENAVSADGHGFSLQFDGTNWNFTSRPAGYAAASVISSNSQEIRINLDNDTNTPLDLTINLDRPAASSDSIDFDLNAANSLALTHVQDIANQQFTGDTVNNTDITTDHNALVADNSGVNLNYNAGTNTWSMAGLTQPEYAMATVSGGSTGVSIDLNNDGTADINASFKAPLLADSTITFDINGTSSWSDAPSNANGHLTFMADFLGGNSGNTEQAIALNIGAKNDGSRWISESLASTQFAKASSTTFESADGYNAGDLNTVGVSTAGLISGSYSNGNIQSLFQVATAHFSDPSGLKQIGNGLYSATTRSGDPITGTPGSNGLGSIIPNSLEESNVDIAEEFAHLILFQRGYEANLKTVEIDNQMKGDILNIIS